MNSKLLLTDFFKLMEHGEIPHLMSISQPHIISRFKNVNNRNKTRDNFI